MSQHMMFRRQPVPQQVAQKQQVTMLPPPTRGLTDSENYAFMQPGGAIICDNWIPTMRGVKLRGGCTRWCVLPETDPVISAFEYNTATVARMFAANATKLYDVTFGGAPTLVKGGQTSGNYAAAQLANASTTYLTVVNDGGDFPLRFDGSTWTTLSGDQIKGPLGSAVEHGRNLVHVWKYRSRLFFIELGSMNAWYLGIDAIGGSLLQIPLSGAATRGGKLLFGATWSLDAGDGTDDKCCFVTDQGEILIFTGSNPGDVNNWRQEGRYEMSKPMGMNASLQVGGDLLIATIDGIIPVSAAITKDRAQLDLAAVTYNIKSIWRREVLDKRLIPWTMKKWDEFGGIFVTWPGGKPGARYCAIVNSGTGAWARLPGYDATCFIRLRGDFFFGTQTGIIMQADRTGRDDGVPYLATLVGSWGAFQSGAANVIWHQARAVFTAGPSEQFNPQLSTCVDYVVDLPPAPSAGGVTSVQDVWDQGEWDEAKWDQPTAGAPALRTTGWISIGRAGFTHAPVLQVYVAQQVRPSVELISIDATFERHGVTV